MACLTLIVMAALPATASARVTVSDETRYYTVDGRTGADVVHQMSRKGPRNGFLARAIAQTWYSPEMTGDVVLVEGLCRVRDPGVHLHIRYTYPQLGSRAEARLRAKWPGFLKGVVKHESRHAELAHEMAETMDVMLQRFAMRPPGKSCHAAQRELSRRMDAIWKHYDNKQNAYDRREHQRGGKVDSLVRDLIH